MSSDLAYEQNHRDARWAAFGLPARVIQRRKELAAADKLAAEKAKEAAKVEPTVAA